MDRCSEVREALYAAERFPVAGIEKHLLECSECRSLAKQLTAIQDTLVHVTTPPRTASPGWEDVALRAEGGRLRISPGLRLALKAAMTCVVVLIVVTGAQRWAAEKPSDHMVRFKALEERLGSMPVYDPMVTTSLKLPPSTIPRQWDLGGVDVETERGLAPFLGPEEDLFEIETSPELARENPFSQDTKPSNPFRVSWEWTQDSDSDPWFMRREKR